jgi:twitching motility protein PilT
VTPMGLIERCLRAAAERGASDLHLSESDGARLRVDGELERLPVDVPAHTLRDEALRLLDEASAVLWEREGHADFSFSMDDVGRVRAQVYREKGRVALALRLIPSRPPLPEEIGVPERVVALAEERMGLILVTGPTGSGKSTTLASLVRHLNETRALHIVTLEDPVEYLHESARSVVHQREVGRDTASFAGGLRAALREDPDVILVGEMRDPETMAIALTAAETGHLVLSTLHTGDASGAIDRVIDSFPPHQQQQIRVQLAAVLSGVVAQTLLRRQDGPGRVAAFEVLVATAAVRNLIREAKTYQIPSAIQTGGAQGMQSMEAALRALKAAGRIS